MGEESTLPWRLALTYTYLFLSLLTTVIHSGDYFLFESDSEEEEEALPEDPRPATQNAFQVSWSHAFLLCLWSSWMGQCGRTDIQGPWSPAPIYHRNLPSTSDLSR